jgi:multiple sugar transport system permease protein
MKQSKSLPLRIGATVIVAVFAVSCIFPFIWMLSTSFKYEIDVMEFPIRLIPKNWNFNNYAEVMRNSNFPTYYWNSIKVAVISVAGQLLVTTMAAYAFARLRFRGKEALYALYLATMMVPAQVIILPKYLYFSQLGLANTHWALILPSFFSVFGVLLMRGAFQSIPFELTEAAYIDGASHPLIYWKLILPLAKPALMTLVLIAFTWSWNDYINPLIFLSKDAMLTLTVGLQKFADEASNNYALIMAGASLSLIPIIAIFMTAQKYFIESFASAGIKG